jgi:hypothetical protein
MKVTINWRKVVGTALLAAGIWVPSAVQAANIPLADPSFEDYAISTAVGAGSQYAYANEYRPTSAWIDDQDHFSEPYVQDTNPSSWLYTSAYANDLTVKRGSPRTGNQALHGKFRYSTQVVPGATFEAGKVYTFSAYAQGDDNAGENGGNWQSRVFMYLFNGSQPFSEANALTFKRFSPTDLINTGPSHFVNRDPLWTAAESQAAWQRISISWTVQPGAPEIGAPIGVGFWMGDDAAVDDTSLVRSIPGDFDADEDVDGADFVIWQTNFPKASGASLFTGDGDGDGDVDGADFVIWQTNFPTSPPPVMVPEPGAIVLFVGAAAGLAGFRRFVSKKR